ncbi:MAG: hypothetical protein ACFFBD_04095 [Candidatus Hodarchaeota archaeon]
MAKDLGKLWVILPNGLCAIHRDYSQGRSIDSMSTSDQLIFSGFVTAIFSAFQEMKGGEVEVMQMKNSEIHYKKENDFILAFQVDRKNQFRKNLSKILNEVSRTLLNHGRFLFADSKQVDTSDPNYNQLIEKIDSNFNFNSFGILDDQRLGTLLLKYLNDLLPMEEAVEQINQLFGDQILKRMIKRKLTEAIEDINSIIDHLEIKPGSEHKEKFVLLMQRLFNWFEMSKEFVHEGW